MTIRRNILTAFAIVTITPPAWAANTVKSSRVERAGDR